MKKQLLPIILMIGSGAFAATKSVILPLDAKNVQVIQVRQTQVYAGRAPRKTDSHCYHEGSEGSPDCDQDETLLYKPATSVLLSYDAAPEVALDDANGPGESHTGWTTYHKSTLYFASHAGTTATVKISTRNIKVQQLLVDENASKYCPPQRPENFGTSSPYCHEKIVYKKGKIVSSAERMAIVTLQ